MQHVHRCNTAISGTQVDNHMQHCKVDYERQCIQESLVWLECIPLTISQQVVRLRVHTVYD